MGIQSAARRREISSEARRAPAGFGMYGSVKAELLTPPLSPARRHRSVGAATPPQGGWHHGSPTSGGAAGHCEPEALPEDNMWHSTCHGPVAVACCASSGPPGSVLQPQDGCNRGTGSPAAVPSTEGVHTLEPMIRNQLARVQGLSPELLQQLTVQLVCALQGVAAADLRAIDLPGMIASAVSAVASSRYARTTAVYSPQDRVVPCSSQGADDRASGRLADSGDVQLAVQSSPRLRCSNRSLLSDTHGDSGHHINGTGMQTRSAELRSMRRSVGHESATRCKGLKQVQGAEADRKSNEDFGRPPGTVASVPRGRSPSAENMCVTKKRSLREEVQDAQRLREAARQRRRQGVIDVSDDEGLTFGPQDVVDGQPWTADADDSVAPSDKPALLPWHEQPPGCVKFIKGTLPRHDIKYDRQLMKGHANVQGMQLVAKERKDGGGMGDSRVQVHELALAAVPAQAHDSNFQHDPCAAMVRFQLIAVYFIHLSVKSHSPCRLVHLVAVWQEQL
jgi:hypothetical protein